MTWPCTDTFKIHCAACLQWLVEFSIHRLELYTCLETRVITNSLVHSDVLTKCLAWKDLDQRMFLVKLQLLKPDLIQLVAFHMVCLLLFFFPYFQICSHFPGVDRCKIAVSMPAAVWVIQSELAWIQIAFVRWANEFAFSLCLEKPMWCFDQAMGICASGHWWGRNLCVAEELALLSTCLEPVCPFTAPVNLPRSFFQEMCSSSPRWWGF